MKSLMVTLASILFILSSEQLSLSESRMIWSELNLISFGDTISIESSDSECLLLSPEKLLTLPLLSNIYKSDLIEIFTTAFVFELWCRLSDELELSPIRPIPI